MGPFELNFCTTGTSCLPHAACYLQYGVVEVVDEVCEIELVVNEYVGGL